MLSTFATLATLALSPVASRPRSVVLTGPVESTAAPRMFTVRVGDRGMLACAGPGKAEQLRIGDQVRVRGTVPVDRLKLAADELLAVEVEVLP